MHYLRTEAAFDSAHFLFGYKGKCSNIHGHRWRVVVEARSEELNTDSQTRGMVMDFGELKAEVKGLCDHLDHCFIYEKGSLKPATVEALNDENFRMIEIDFRPTAENLSKYIFETLKEKGLGIHRVEVYETPNNCAIYEEP
ncbi:MAG: 6-carboxytetrahydropterin synthase [Clostridiales bacterium]|nr:6-carboxytetrahydropterin synthase [Clostridiales bacterium]MDU1042744.1 6-carboxytetrahydropterin synthase [Clostridiales bacterium]